MHWRDRAGTETAIIEALVELDDKRVLEVGCGTGRLTAMAARHATHVYAFDPDEARVNDARIALPANLRRRVRFGVHGAAQLAAPRRRFDIALCGWSL
jgi:ubiquinone/menaquinone biosynthesis C-methylase UbiE